MSHINFVYLICDEWATLILSINIPKTPINRYVVYSIELYPNIRLPSCQTLRT
jgi:hypothetical protein